MRGGQVRFGLQQRHLLAGELQIRLALREISFGLFHRRLIRAQIQDVQHVARMHFLAGMEEPFVDIAVHAAAHLNRIAGVGLRRIIGEYRDVGGCNFGNQYGRGRRLLTASLGLRSGLTTPDREQHAAGQDRCQSGITVMNTVTPHEWY